MPERRTILCVDDNAAFVDNLREILEETGYAVLGAGSCVAALEVAAGGFAVALVDVKLPDGDGTALAPRLREISPDAQVILLTGFASLESAAAAVRSGAWAFLVKPVAPPDLLRAIEQAIRHVELLKERRALQSRARVAEKLAAIGTMTAGLSHEIKNPLNAASLQLQVLERRLRKVPEELQGQLRQPLTLVQDEINRLNRLLQEFLDFARPRELTPTTVDLSGVLSRLFDLLAPEAERAGIALVRAWDDGVLCLGEEARLRQAFLNLLRNALQATPQGGSVHVGMTADNDVRVVVEDTGLGIPPEHRIRIFEPFFTTKAAGSGLGLPLVHTIIEQHHGSITVEHPDRGARFVVHLPAASS